MANADFIQRATPHLQMVSPLQQWIIEEQQAKEDPMEDEIEGLDAEVLLNADPLEEGEQAAVDLEELQTAHPPPSWTSHTPHTLQQTPPPSMQVLMSVTTGSPGDGKALRGRQTWAQPLGWPLSHRVCWVVSELVQGDHS